MAHSKKELDAYIERTSATAEAAGAVRTPIRIASKLEEHLSWLVRFQLKGVTMGDIWRSSKDRGRRAFEKAIRETADLVGLILRDGKKPS